MTKDNVKKIKCSEDIYDSGSMRPRKCHNFAVAQENGRWVCKMHSAASTKKRRDQVSDRYQTGMKKREDNLEKLLNSICEPVKDKMSGNDYKSWKKDVLEWLKNFRTTNL